MMLDTYNNELVADVAHFISNDKLKGMLTDYEWLDAIAQIVEKRKLVIGVTDCATGLRYEWYMGHSAWYCSSSLYG